MLLGDFILTLLAIIFLAVLVIRYKVTKEDSFLHYVCGRGFLKYMFKAFAMLYIILIIAIWIGIYFEKHPINTDFLYYKLW